MTILNILDAKLKNLDSCVYRETVSIQLPKRQSQLQQTTFKDTFFIFFILFFSEKIRFDISCESSVRQRIHMKHQTLFSSKDKSEKLKCRLLHFCLAL